jgi:tRNA (guanine37-N1)-methyltransferase
MQQTGSRMTVFIDILTIFPEMFQGPFSESIVKRAQEKDLVNIRISDIRAYALDRHKTVDDYPFGGGAGMLMKPEPIFDAVDDVRRRAEGSSSKPFIIMLCPQGEVFSQPMAQELAQKEHLILICGHYEGMDERVREHLVDAEISIGDYILTGGELPAMVIVDAVTRLIPGVLGSASSAQTESFTDNLLDYPQYTRPREYRGHAVPDVLLSGDHERIRIWRRKEAIRKTWLKRPDLIKSEELDAEGKKLLKEVMAETHGQDSCE